MIHFSANGQKHVRIKTLIQTLILWWYSGSRVRDWSDTRKRSWSSSSCRLILSLIRANWHTQTHRILNLRNETAELGLNPVNSTEKKIIKNFCTLINASLANAALNHWGRSPHRQFLLPTRLNKDIRKCECAVITGDTDTASKSLLSCRVTRESVCVCVYWWLK